MSSAIEVAHVDIIDDENNRQPEMVDVGCDVLYSFSRFNVKFPDAIDSDKMVKGAVAVGHGVYIVTKTIATLPFMILFGSP